jgi:hypothetical protein
MKKYLTEQKWSEESSFETPVRQDVSLGTEELNWVQSSELAVTEQQEESN